MNTTRTLEREALNAAESRLQDRFALVRSR
jgi:hypothetical protein